MRYSTVLPCLLALMMSFPAKSDPGADTLEVIATGIREYFPRSEISAFTCAGMTCSKAINFGHFSAVIVVTKGADARPAAIAVMMGPPRPGSTTEVRKFFEIAFNACAVAIISLTAPNMPLDQRADFAANVTDEGIGYGEWIFARSTTRLSKSGIFEAKRQESQ